MGFRNCHSGRKDRGISRNLIYSFLFCLFIIAISAPALLSHAAAPEATTANVVTGESVTANLTKSSSMAKHWIDSIGDKPFTEGKVVTLSADIPVVKIVGWAVDPEAKLAARGVWAEIDGNAYPAQYGLKRPDVAAALKNEAFAPSGYLCNVPISALGPGQHTFGLIVLSNNKQYYYQVKMKPITIEHQ